MERITSFSVDHDFIREGVYISRVDGDVTTYDLRTRVPNAGDYMDTTTAHSVEHQFATFIRNGKLSKNVIYFGPMGCRTGFYLLMRGVEPQKVYEEIRRVLGEMIAYDGPVFGSERKECGNYRDLSNASAVAEAKRYLSYLPEEIHDFDYPKGENV